MPHYIKGYHCSYLINAFQNICQEIKSYLSVVCTVLLIGFRLLFQQKGIGAAVRVMTERTLVSYESSQCLMNVFWFAHNQFCGVVVALVAGDNPLFIDDFTVVFTVAGFTEHGVDSRLVNRSFKARSAEGMELLAELGSHDHNHLPRRSLKGKNSCRAYFDGPRVTFDKRQRKEVFLWIKQATSDMLEKLGDDGMFMTAWRIAARTWLHQNNYITIVRNGKVLPYYS